MFWLCILSNTFIPEEGHTNKCSKRRILNGFCYSQPQQNSHLFGSIKAIWSNFLIFKENFKSKVLEFFRMLFNGALGFDLNLEGNIMIKVIFSNRNPYFLLWFWKKRNLYVQIWLWTYLKNFRVKVISHSSRKILRNGEFQWEVV